MDRRAGQLQQEYLNKARRADQRYNGVRPGTRGQVVQCLPDLGEVRGVVCGNFGEVSEATHLLLARLVTSRKRTAGVNRGRRSQMRSKDA